MELLFNKYSFKVGNIVILDKEFNNSCKVKIWDMSKPAGCFSTVSLLDADELWDTLTTRLTPVEDI